MRCYGGGFRAPTAVADDGVNDAHIGFNSTNSDGKDLATEARSGAGVAGSESRADVALKDEPAGVVADIEAGEGERQRAIRFLRDKMRLEASRSGRQQFWADVGWSGSSRLQTSANSQTMAPRGASEWMGEAGMSG